jgi:two-component system sensor histidine kinase RegB
MPAGEAGKTTGPSRQNLLRLWLIRSILVAALLFATAWLWQFSEVELPWIPLLALLLGTALVNVPLLYRLWLPRPVGEVEFFANLLLDVAFLTAVLYFSGGSSNPLVSYYLIPVIISAAVLRPAYTWAVAGIALAAYTVLFYRYVPFAPFSMGGHGGMMSAHLVGMWVNFAFSAVLIAGFVTRIAGSMRRQESAIAKVREDALRDEQIVSVAGIAAGAAHELRTPLATMRVLLDELRDENPDLAGDLGLLQRQVGRCESILGELVASARQAREVRRDSLAGLVDELMYRWVIARPEVTLDVDVAPGAARLGLRFDESLYHALLNFLHNAADASPDSVRLAARPDDGQALIVIEDRGAGIPADVADALGRRFVSRKDGGLGLGVLIGSASVERLDGSVTLRDREGGGTRWEVRLPICSERKR